MSHPFGDLVTQHLHRKHGLSQAKLAEGILQDPAVIGKMCKGQRLHGPQARERVCAIIDWLRQQAVLTTVDEANGLLMAAGMATLGTADPSEAQLLHQLLIPAPSPVLLTPPRIPVTTKPRTNLPISLTSFIGRIGAITEVAQLVVNHRLVTLTGAGGVGKTRLALEVGKAILDFPLTQSTNPKFLDGVWFVDLSPLTNPDAIPQRILDLWRVLEQAQANPFATLTTYLRTKQMLLILDNCEHLIDACARLAETLLQHCPQLVLLATSREALNIGGETPWRVPSLTRPRAEAGWDGQAAVQLQFTPEALAWFEAVTLFVERAGVRQPGFALTTTNAPAVAQICSRLDGIPLALEMAAALVNSFTVEELARRLDGVFDGRFQLLTGARTAPLRHQTLRATLEWSYGLLAPAEQRLLTHLSVFTGGWTAVAAEEVTVCSLDLLAQLVNKSLVIADQQNGQTRYRLLETVRQFAAEQATLDEQAQRQIRRQHSRYYLTLLGKQEQPLQGQQQRAALDTIRSEIENISAAWRLAVEQHEFTLLDPALHALFLYCEVRGSFGEGASLFAAAAAELSARLAIGATERSILQLLWGQVVVRLGACDVMLNRFAQGEQHLQEGLPYVTKDWERAFVLVHLGQAAAWRGKLPLAIAQLRESLAISQQCNDLAGMAYALHRLSARESDYAVAYDLCAESLALYRKIGRPDRIASELNQMGWYKFWLGDYRNANAHWSEGLALCQQLDLLDERAWGLHCMGFAAWCQGELTVAERNLQEALAISMTAGRQMMIGVCKAELALVLSSVGQVAQAIALAQEAVALMREINNQIALTGCVIFLGVVLFAAGDLMAVRRTLLEAVQQAWNHQIIYSLMTAFYYFAELLVLESQTLDRPVMLERQALAYTVLSCVCTHKATWHFFKDKAAKLQARIEDALPADLRTAAIARGQSCTLEEIVATLLGEAAS